MACSTFSRVAGALRVLPVLRLPALLRDFAVAERVAGFGAVRVVRAVVLFAAVVRVAADAGRRVVRAVLAALLVRAAAGLARVVVADFGARLVVADLVARAGALRAVVVAFARVGAVRVDGVRVEVARLVVARVVARPVTARAVDLPAAVRFAGAAAFDRAVFAAPVLLPVLVAPALARVAGVRADFATVLEAVLLPLAAALATRGFFAAGFSDFAAAFLAGVERVLLVVPLRVVRAVVPRAVVPALRRPPARTAIARVRRPSDPFSVLMVRILDYWGSEEWCVCTMRSLQRFTRSLSANDRWCERCRLKLTGTGTDRRVAGSARHPVKPRIRPALVINMVTSVWRCPSLRLDDANHDSESHA